jgi:signal peptidase
MKILVKTIEWVVFAVLLLVLFVSASSLLPTKNIVSSYIVTSSSMEPTILTGSLVLTSYKNPKGLKKGDIVTFIQPGNPKNTIVHRIVAINNKESLSFQTKGDHNNTLDTWAVSPNGVKERYF